MNLKLLNETEKTIREERLAEEGDRIVVAVSGGPDSMALLHILFLLKETLRFELVAAHANHGFRPAESKREAEAVERLAARFGIPYAYAELNMPAYIAKTGQNPQEASRDRRYAFLRETAERYGAAKIALAHHADDQAETVLMRIIRGTGPSGLAGIPIKRSEENVELIRPFLRIYKKELVRHCEQFGLPYCSDSSNAKRDYFRNRIRLDAMPFLQSYNEHFPEALNRLAETVRAEDEWMEAETRRAFSELAEVGKLGGGSACGIDRQRFARLPLALQRRLIKLILSYVFAEKEMFDFTRIEAARKAILQEGKPHAAIDLHGRVQLVREYDRILFVEALPEPAGYVYEIAGDCGRLDLKEAKMSLEWTVMPASAAAATLGRGDRNAACFDMAKLEMPLSVRSRMPGDRMEPFGLKGSKKVKDMFIDEKIPVSIRETIPHLVDAKGRILWIPGIRQSRHAAVSEQTERLFVMRVQIRSSEGLR
jgi:tRNA(Ile)-lysidine synthase